MPRVLFLRTTVLSLSALIAAAGVFAQEHEPSHSERFSRSAPRLEDVERTATATLAGVPDDVEALLSRARVRIRLGKLADALADFERASALAPARADIRAQLALAHLRMGSFAEAKFAADAALALDPENPAANYTLGLLLLAATTDVEGAAQRLALAAARGPAAPEVRFDLLRAHARRGDRVRTAVELRVLRVLLPPDDARIAHGEGLLAAIEGNLDAAVAKFRVAAQGKPALAASAIEGPLAVARALTQQGKTDQAIALLQQALTRFPESIEAHHGLALAFEKAGQAAAARAEYAAIEALGRKLGVVSAGAPGKKP